LLKQATATNPALVADFLQARRALGRNVDKQDAKATPAPRKGCKLTKEEVINLKKIKLNNDFRDKQEKKNDSRRSPTN
jgi:hypothetical protein